MNILFVHHQVFIQASMIPILKLYRRILGIDISTIAMIINIFFILTLIFQYSYNDISSKTWNSKYIIQKRSLVWLERILAEREEEFKAEGSSAVKVKTRGKRTRKTRNVDDESEGEPSIKKTILEFSELSELSEKVKQSLGNPEFGSFINKLGLKIQTYAWKVKNPRGVVVLLHGFQACTFLNFLKQNVTISEDYQKAEVIDAEDYHHYSGSWVESLNNSNYSVYGMDFQGHGNSDSGHEGKIFISNSDDLAEDVIQFLSIISERVSTSQSSSDESGTKREIPIFIMGFSMGGNMALRAIELLEKEKEKANYPKFNIKGAVILSGMVSLKSFKQRPLYKFLLYPLFKIVCSVYPSGEVSCDLRYKKYPCMNEIMSSKYTPSNKPTYKTINQIIAAEKKLNTDVKFIPRDIPLLFFHSKNDDTVSPSGSQEFFEKIENERKEFVLLDDMEHSLASEPGNEKILQQIIEWLSRLSDEDN